MPLARLLIANRGEIAIRIARAAAELEIETVAVHPVDDADSLHTRRADDVRVLEGAGPSAYLDIDQLVAVATATGCDSVHPGYGFLSESAAFARRCQDAGLTFVGPSPEVLATFGDKGAARALAQRLGVPVLAGTTSPTTAEEAAEVLAGLGSGAAILLKAIAGGGGRGMRVVHRPSEVAEAWERCRSEAQQAFGNGDLYVEQLLPDARHIEVQVAGNGSGGVVAVGDRECSLQRRHQKLVEVAPAPGLDPPLRAALHDAATRLTSEVGYRGLGTVELLVGPVSGGAPSWVFMEVNARLQVEHTVTEAVTGIDLVQAQLRLAGGASFAEVGLGEGAVPPPRGAAVQARVNLEVMDADGAVVPSGGTITVFEPPSGPGIRVDTFGYAGYTTSPRYDSLLAKVVAHSPDGHAAALRRTGRALEELRVEGVATNATFLRALLTHPDVVAGQATTTFVDDHMAALVASAARLPSSEHHPLAPQAAVSERAQGPDGSVAVAAPVQGTVVVVRVADGDSVTAGAELVVLEAMKMEHVITASTSGTVRAVVVAVGETVQAGQPLVFVEPGATAAGEAVSREAVDLDHVRADLAETLDRHAVGLDEARADAVARHHAVGHRSARENIADLCDPGSFVEYAPLAIAAQRRRRSLEDLIANTPGDGLVGGLATVNAPLVGGDRARAVAVSYDYTVLAGTQGYQNHRKKDRLFELAERERLPVVLFAEGGGGRPGDTDSPGVAGLDCLAFNLFGKLSGLVPLVGVVAGRCFAGNAALLGCCDVIIATPDANIGMGGPAMIEGGGLGVFRPEEVGPVSVQVPDGVVDVLAEDEADAVRLAKQYLSYFQGPIEDWACEDQRALRHLIPENRLRTYDVRTVIDGLCDTGSVLELRPGFGLGMVTALARVEGKAVGIVANNPTHLAGAIDAPAADKAARFLQLCDAFDIPVLFLCDTPGFMVGPEAEATGLVRHCARLFVNGANLTVPFATIVLRKGYGLGAQAMAGGSFKAPLFIVSWPTGEFGGMGLEGAVRLGYRKELEAVEDPVEREALFAEMVARSYTHGKALNMASHLEIDDVIDPVDSRRWITSVLLASAPPARREGKKRPNIDTW